MNTDKFGNLVLLREKLRECKIDIENQPAKSNPPETIREHTDNLLKQAELLINLGYIKSEDLSSDLITACEYHDLGKANSEFKNRINKHYKFNSEIEIPHNVLSLFFVDKDMCIDYNAVCFAVAYHHYHSDSPIDILNNQKQLIQNFVVEIFGDEKLIKQSRRYVKLLNDIFKSSLDDREKEYAALLKGFLHKCDYSASAGLSACEYKNDFLMKSLDRWKLDNNIKVNELQNFCLENNDKDIIVTAPTGQGKTEAGLMWCGDNKCFFVLPLKTAINAMYQRISELIAGKRFTDFVEDDFITISDKSALLHSDIASEYLNKYKNSKADATFDLSYIARSKQMSLPMTVCTPDQIFDFVLKYPGYEYKLATCSYSKFIIDEIQMYSPDLLAAIIYAVKLIHQVGGKVAVLTATLPPFIRQEFIEIFGQNVPMADFSEYGIVRHNVKVSESVMQADNIIEKISELKSDTVKKFLVVCNSIDTADLIYDDIKNYYENDESISVNLFHAGFIKRDRQKKENDILNASRDNSKTEVWISTSVVEASLDIDFDILFTELSDLFSLFQRFGRVNRKGRKNCDNYNCYVFTELQGNAKRYKFTDETIYKFSKQACMSIDGIITETDKTKLINEYLSVKNIENSEYLKDYRKALSELEKNLDYMKSKSEGLRSIDRTDVIPREVYNQNVDDINKSIDIINDKNSSKSEILEAYDNIQKLTVSVSNYNVRMDKNTNSYLQNNFINCRGVKYPVLENCEYSFEKGIVIVNKDKTEHKDNKNLIDNFI